MASFGEKLRRERELRGIDLQEIADGTKISIRLLEALEADRIELLPGGIFRRSFVKAYADHVGLDPDRTVSEFLEAHSENGASEGSSGTAPGRASLYRRLFFVLLAGFAAAGGWRFAHRAALPPAPPAAAKAPDLVFPRDRLLPSVSSAPQAAGPAAGPLVLVVSARETCWVGAQADGHVVMSRVLSSGESQRLEAKDEIVLAVGNAGALDLRINDRPGLPLGRRGEVRRNIVITKESLPSLVESAPVTPSHRG